MNRLLAAVLVVSSLTSVAQPRDERCRHPRTRAQLKECRERAAQQAPPARAEPEKAADAAPQTLLRPARIEFEGSNMWGQRNNAGGVYLYDRKQLANRTMIHKPDNFRAEIISPD